MYKDDETYEPFFGKWKKEKTISTGNHWTVYETEHKENEVVYTSAVKIISFTKNDKTSQDTMLDGMMQTMDHLIGESETTNIVRLYEHQEYKKDDHTDIVVRMERLRTFAEFMKSSKLTEYDVVKLGIDLCKALELCEKQKLTHCNVALSNIMVTEDGTYKLGGLENSTLIRSLKNTEIDHQISQFMAPEFYQKGVCSHGADIYALGLILYTLLNNGNCADISQRVSGEKLTQPEHAADKIWKIIQKACDSKVVKRYHTATKFRKDLEKELKNTDVETDIRNNKMLVDTVLDTDSGSHKEKEVVVNTVEHKVRQQEEKAKEENTEEEISETNSEDKADAGTNRKEIEEASNEEEKVSESQDEKSEVMKADEEAQKEEKSDDTKADAEVQQEEKSEVIETGKETKEESDELKADDKTQLKENSKEKNTQEETSGTESLKEKNSEAKNEEKEVEKQNFVKEDVKEAVSKEEVSPDSKEEVSSDSKKEASLDSKEETDTDPVEEKKETEEQNEESDEIISDKETKQEKSEKQNTKEQKSTDTKDEKKQAGKQETEKSVDIDETKKNTNDAEKSEIETKEETLETKTLDAAVTIEAKTLDVNVTTEADVKEDTSDEKSATDSKEKETEDASKSEETSTDLKKEVKKSTSLKDDKQQAEKQKAEKSVEIDELKKDTNEAEKSEKNTRFIVDKQQAEKHQAWRHQVEKQQFKKQQAEKHQADKKQFEKHQEEKHQEEIHQVIKQQFKKQEIGKSENSIPKHKVTSIEQHKVPTTEPSEVTRQKYRSVSVESRETARQPRRTADKAAVSAQHKKKQERSKVDFEERNTSDVSVELIAALDKLKEVEAAQTKRDLHKIAIRRRFRSFRKKLTTVCAVGMVVFLITGCLRIKMYLHEGVVVPSLIGMSQDSAKRLAANDKLIPEVSAVYNSEVQEGTVISQNIEQGTKVKQDSSIQLVVSNGEQAAELGNFVGLKKDEAQKVADSQQIKLIVEEIFSEKVEIGKVIMQDLPVGTKVVAGQELRLTVSKGPETVVIPDFAGKAQTEIKDACNVLGLDTELKYQKSTSVEKGYFLAQDIPASEAVRKGAKITITLSSGNSEPSSMQSSSEIGQSTKSK